ncbi:TspO/MBR family protein [Tetraselmis virus 1]|uniref:TspO/MBR family protein n=1 Tax=Tetraselmis virus 1 TaxID=2060617 RepID=A0A2P0VN25_9VIRU|nr:TspO/MBR family protein [Tetraselmis virus 1]AUF82291.1 TspO/MBR family protein [Tetraselmis virus 1]
MLSSLKPEMLLMLVPLIAGFGASAICPANKNDPANPVYTPPGWVFGAVWAILFMLLGYSWYRNSGDQKIMFVYSALVAALIIWIPLTNCFNKKTEGVWMIALCSTLTGVCMLLTSNVDRLLLMPLLAWLVFATVLSAITENNRSSVCAASHTSPMNLILMVPHA